MPFDTRQTVSVLTLARGRAAHLANVVRGLIRQDRMPDELVVAVMQEDLYEDLPHAPFPIRQIRVPYTDALPLSEARNTVARAALGDALIFLDVDCIPAPSLVADYLHHLSEAEGLFMGEVLYLPAGRADRGWDYPDFDAVAVRHSDRQGPPQGPRRRCEDYRCFWSLNFALSRATWEASGGFDEAYRGYGGEDTDFGRTLDDRGIAIWWIRGGRVYHQHHPHCMPPIHHIPAILHNTEVFARKWGHRTMEHWLHAFRLMGLVRATASGLKMVREPGPADFALCQQQSHMPYAATGRVIRILEDRARMADGLGPDTRTPEERHAAMTAAQEELLAVAAPVTPAAAALPPQALGARVPATVAP